MQVSVISLCASLLFAEQQSLSLLFAAIALAYAPLCLNVLKLIPYLGATLGTILAGTATTPKSMSSSTSSTLE